MQNLKLLLLPLLVLLSHVVWAAPVKILPLGDSITHGADYNPPYSSYRDELFDLLTDDGYDFEFVGTQSSNYASKTLYHDGIPSIRADQIYNGGVVNGNTIDNLQTKLTNYDIDIVLLHAGTNDVIQGNGSNSTTLADIENIIDELQAKNSNVIVLVAKIIPIYSPDISTGLNNLLTNSWAQGQSTNTSDVIIVDQHSGITSSDLYSDLVHPVSSGEAKMANKWFDTLILQDILADQLLLEANLELSAQGTAIEGTDFTINSTSDSNGAILYSSTTQNICTVNNTTVTPLTSGICTLLGEQEKNGNYLSDTDTINVTVLPKKNQTVTLENTTSSAFVADEFTVQATSTSALIDFVYLTSTPNICTLSNNIVKTISEGDCQLTATQVGNLFFYPATSSIKTISILRNNQTVTLSSPDSAKLGASFSVNATASSSLTVEIFSETPEVCVITENKADPLTAGTCTITAKQSGNTIYKPQTIAKSITITEAEAKKAGGLLSPINLFLLLLVSLFSKRRFLISKA